MTLGDSWKTRLAVGSIAGLSAEATDAASSDSQT